MTHQNKIAPVSQKNPKSNVDESKDESRAATSPVRQLQENATGTYERIFKEHQDRMSCKRGCSACCYVERTVFPCEADVIATWVQSLDPTGRQDLLEKWQRAEDVSQKTAARCAFLVEDECSIYPARPIICRTQGAPLRFRDHANEEKVDSCPLNFAGGSALPEKSSWIDLDRLNTLLSIAEQYYQQHVGPNESQNVVEKAERIPLQSLKKAIWNWLRTQSDEG